MLSFQLQQNSVIDHLASLTKAASVFFLSRTSRYIYGTRKVYLLFKYLCVVLRLVFLHDKNCCRSQSTNPFVGVVDNVEEKRKKRKRIRMANWLIDRSRVTILFFTSLTIFIFNQELSGWKARGKERNRRLLLLKESQTAMCCRSVSWTGVSIDDRNVRHQMIRRLSQSINHLDWLRCTLREQQSKYQFDRATYIMARIDLSLDLPCAGLVLLPPSHRVYCHLPGTLDVLTS